MAQSNVIDMAAVDQRGVTREEVDRQLALFRNPPGFADLVRSCAIGDGIERVQDENACLDAYENARRLGRLTKFVPASGAASRMLQALLVVRDRGLSAAAIAEAAEQGDSAASLAIEFLRGIRRLPFVSALRSALGASGDDFDRAVAEGRFGDLVDALAGERGLGYAALPKGLLPFHLHPEGARTPFEEHLSEATELIGDAEGRVRVHFTVSPEHVDLFETKLAECRRRLESGGYTLDVTFSTQAPHTDTVAVDLDDELLLDADGRVVFRPGGHGALLENLAGCGADIALVQNIDNIQPAGRRPPSLRWKKVLLGRLILAQAADNETSRPSRVCGVVENSGEPGGGPFWVRGADGDVSLQIVEGAQVDHESSAQKAIFAGATHFNPVLLACGLRDRDGEPFDLTHFVDQRAVFISRKSLGGRDLKALERPGLWNGSMAHWNTRFVEIGAEAFTPVKTVVDLLRPEHLG